VEKLVHDAHRITDSRCSCSPALIVWCLLLLGHDMFTDLAVLTTSDILIDMEGVAEAATVFPSGAFSPPAPPDIDGSGSLHSCAQKNEKLGIDGNVVLLGSAVPSNENPDGVEGGALSATNAEKEDLQANVGEQTSSDKLWPVIEPPVLKLTSRLRDASGVEEHEPGSSLRRPISWQWLHESRDWPVCSCIHECSAKNISLDDDATW
jgi:hypothetical protein